ncbi:hypothetical protein [Arthrobacter sp. UYEF3]|uniref:hypothetical protein n=1 Tax=Arthrobacter sp. UYEF3 TaxID=1756365 RepID=UPI0033989706
MAELLTLAVAQEAGSDPLAEPRSPATQGAGAPALRGPADQAPSHCGTPMRWTAPVLEVMAAFSFDTGSGSAELPPVWRCTCGFQLDGIVRTPTRLAALS